MKYKVGDKVRVRSDLKYGKAYGGNIATGSMVDLAGDVVVISLVGEKCYQVYGISTYWTDEMFEPVEEMSAEEFAKDLTAMCEAHSGCVGCQIKRIDSNKGCIETLGNYYEEVIDILNEWKSARKKKPIETEFVWYVKIIEADTHLLKHEELLKTDFSIPMDKKKEEVLKKYCSEHDGEYYAIAERRCVVKE